MSTLDLFARSKQRKQLGPCPSGYKETKEVVAVTIASVNVDRGRLAFGSHGSHGGLKPQVQTLVIQLPQLQFHWADLTKLDELTQYHGFSRRKYNEASKVQFCEPQKFFLNHIQQQYEENAL